MLGIRNGPSICHLEQQQQYARDEKQQQQQNHHHHRRRQQEQGHNSDPYNIDQRTPSSPMNCCGGVGAHDSDGDGEKRTGLAGIISQGVLHLMLPSLSSTSKDLFVPVLELTYQTKTETIASNNDDKSSSNDNSFISHSQNDTFMTNNRMDDHQNGKDFGDDEKERYAGDDHDLHAADVFITDDFDDCSFIYEIDPLLAVNSDGQSDKVSDDVSDITTMTLGPKYRRIISISSRSSSIIGKRLGQVVPFRGINRRILQWMSISRHPAVEMPSPQPTSSSLSSSLSDLGEVVISGENRDNGDTNTNEYPMKPSCSILLIDANSRQFEIVEAPYIPNVSSCDDILELPSLRSNSKSYRIRFQQYVGLALFYLCTDEDGNTDVLDLGKMFHPGQILPYLQQQPSLWQSQESRRPCKMTSGVKSKHPVSGGDVVQPFLSSSSPSALPTSSRMKKMSWISKKYFSSSSRELKVSCPPTPTTVGTTILMETAVENKAINKKKNTDQLNDVCSGNGKGSGGTNVIPLLVAVPNQMPVSEVKELAQNLLSFPRVVSTLNKRGTK